MRASLLCFGLIGLVGTCVVEAQVTKTMLAQMPHVERFDLARNLNEPPAATILATGKSVEGTQALTYTNMYRTDFYPSWEILNENKVFWYDPKTNATLLLRSNRVFDNSGFLTGGQLRAYITTDNGANWSETELFNEAGRFLGFPNMGLVNPENSGTSVANLNWILFCSNYQKSGTDWNRNGQYGIFAPSSGVFTYEMPAPEIAPPDMDWSIYGDMLSVNEPVPAIYHVSRLNKAVDNGPTQYGVYGMWGYDFIADDFTNNGVPTAWDNSQFQTPNPPNLNSTLNSSPKFGADKDGKLYMAVNNIFVSEPDARVPAVSTSIDQGVTWSAFSRMPANLLESYRTTQGWGSVVAFRPYDQDGFVVTGPDQFSYFYRLADYGSDGQSLTSVHLVEARYDDGTWTLTKVADINGIPLEFIRQDSLSEQISEYAWVVAYSAGSLGNEVEVAITADGQNLLLKWMDENPAFIDSGFVQPIVYQNQSGSWIQDQITSMTATDVYYSYRAVNSSSWSTPVNLTNDRTYDHGTRIPPVIESLESVPLVTLKTITKSEYNQQYPYLPALNQLPDMVLDAHVDYRTPPAVRTSFFNAINPSSVQETSYPFHVNAITPNPAQDDAELSFTMDHAGLVSVDVYSVTGELITHAFDGMLDAGMHGRIVNTSSLATGSYYVTLTIDGKRLSKTLAVVR